MSAEPYATLLPLIREKLWQPDGKPPAAWTERREGSILKQLLVHRSVSQLEVAIIGLAMLRDSKQVNWLHPGAKVTTRALYNSRSGVSQMFELATGAYWRTAKQRKKPWVSSLGDVLFSVLHHSGKYREYLRSPEWKAKRERALVLGAHRCCRCLQVGGELDVHHVSYERLFDEIDEDLEVLCRTCHEAEHAARRKATPDPVEIP